MVWSLLNFSKKNTVNTSLVSLCCLFHEPWPSLSLLKAHEKGNKATPVKSIYGVFLVLLLYVWAIFARFTFLRFFFARFTFLRFFYFRPKPKPSKKQQQKDSAVELYMWNHYLQFTRRWRLPYEIDKESKMLFF